MQEKTEQIRSQEQQDATPHSLPADSSPAETSTRRQLIGRYAKYALVAAPLLVFVSKAHAAHSRP